ncbi:MAG: hypothetical protein WA004_14770 [Saprospiraceae bacterium]
MTKYLFLAGLVALTWSCKNDSPTATVAEASADTQAGDMSYSLLCVDISQPGDKRPHHDVYALVDMDTFKVGTIEVCERIAKEDYAKHEIPADAYDAVGGTGEDKTTYIVYLAKSPEGKIQARIGDMYPGKQGGYTYRTWVALTEEDINPAASLSPADMVGSYVHSGQDKSYVLYLGVSNRTLMGQAFIIDGPLPKEDAAIMEAVGKGTAELIPNIQVDFSANTFNCSKGPGQFNLSGTKVKSMTFSKWGGKEVTLEKRDIGTTYAQ